MRTITRARLAFALLSMFAVSIEAQEIFAAIQNGEMARVKELVATGSDINLGFLEGGMTPVYYALLIKRTEIAEYLFDAGAKMPAVGTTKGNDVLAVALKACSWKFLEKGLKQGFSLLYESELKNTLLHYAAESNSTELVQKLVDIGVPFNKTNIFGWTPLHVAAFHGSKKVVELLLQKGLDKNVRTTDGKSPYDLAAENQKSDVTDYLVSVGADKGGPRFPRVTGDYFGQPKPGRNGVLFAPNVFGNSYYFHGTVTFSTDGNEAFWSSGGSEWTWKGMLTSRRINGEWTLPERVDSMPGGDVPFFSPDGKKLFYVTAEPIEKGGRRGFENIWVAVKIGTRWSEPRPLPPVVNSVQRIHWQISVDKQGNLYFGANQKIYCSEYINGKYEEPKIVKVGNNLPASMPYIAPDGRYLIFYAEGLNIAFRKKDGSWTRSRDLTTMFGTDALCPVVTPDGRYIIYLHGNDNNRTHLKNVISVELEYNQGEQSRDSFRCDTHAVCGYV